MPAQPKVTRRGGAREQVPEVDRLYDYLLGYLRSELLTQV